MHRTMWRQSRSCNQIDGKQSAFSGHSRDRQNPDDLATLPTDIALSFLTQASPRPESGTGFLQLIHMMATMEFDTLQQQALVSIC